MTIEFDVTEQDYLNFNLYHAKHSKHAKASALILRYAAPLLGALAFIIIYKGDLLAVAIGVILVIAYILLFPKYYESLIKRTVKRMIKEGKSNDFIGRQKLSLKDECIEETSPVSTSFVKYSAVEKLCFGYGAIYIYIGAIKAYIVPVTAFSDDVHKNEFINTLKHKTGIDMITEGELK